MTNLAGNANTLHTLVLWVCVAIAVSVFALMLHSIATFRRGSNLRSVAEIGWALVPIVIVVAMAAPAVGTLISGKDSHGSLVQTAQPATVTELAGEIRQKSFHEGSIPL